MNKIKLLALSALFILLSFAQSNAKENIRGGNPGIAPEQNFRSDCTPSLSQEDLNINNVRARLLGGGDLWWDLSDGRYIVPNVAVGSNQDEVSSIFAAALWIGGVDNAGNLKMAAQTYRQGGNDFWPGPLDSDGNVNQSVCLQWDDHFIVLGENITAHIEDYKDNNIIDNPIPDDLLSWPGRGNPYFQDQPLPAGFALPNQDLAPFFDVDADGIYDPAVGDFPVIGVVGCSTGSIDDAAYADQMIWWVYNDKGNIHTETNGDQIGMEIQALAFGYSTNDEINNMTFYKYTLINKATLPLNDTYIGNWVDPDLGCWDNDFVGCDVDRALGIVYNGEATDPDCQDFSGGTVQGYGNDVPILGVDYFRGPKDENGDELGMSAFVYYDNDGSPQGNPNAAQEFYGYLSGFWRDGSPIEFGGNGYQQGTFPTPYMFPDDPSNSSPTAWSECSVGNAPNDRRFVQSSGPFLLNPGATNEVIVGAVWIPKADYPCPSFTKLQQADDKAQGLFNNCFKLTDGPDAPDVNIVELDRELILALSNEESSNNYLEGYSEPSPTIPGGFNDSTYTFQGYFVYQLAKQDVVPADFGDVDKARLVALVDKRDGITKLINYLPADDADINILIPNVMVDADDSGVKHSFRVTEDLFASGDSRLVNHKAYYYSVISYASNNYLPYDPANAGAGGQQIQYIEGRLNIKTYTAIPHINDPENGGTIVNAVYGDEPEITRVDGKGHSGKYLRLTEGSIDDIFDQTAAGRITYEAGSGPFTVKVYNPLKIKDGTYSLALEDEDLTDADLVDPITWVLTESGGTQYFSDRSIDIVEEKLIPELGISIEIEQTEDVEDAPMEGNGFVGANAIYSDANATAWYGAATDDMIPRFMNWMRTGNLEQEQARDPNKVYADVLGGTWYPYSLVSWKPEPTLPAGNFITPAWTNNFSSQVDARNFLKDVNNVDIVITSDKSKWSRCVVVNTYSDYYANDGAPNPDSAPYALRDDASIDKDGNADNTGTTGFSWFPGYAIDVETGERLNIFFGENAYYNPVDDGVIGNAVSLGLPTRNGKDMVWNPNSDFAVPIDPSGQFSGALIEFPLGGQHFVYVTSERYDECAVLATELGGSAFNKINGWSKVIWTSAPMLPQGVEMKSMQDGLIPDNSDLKFELRVKNPYRTYEATGENDSYPEYEFSFSGKAVATGQTETAESALDVIQVVPNPYYAYSSYEGGNNDGKVRITNLPAKCVISIFSLDGRLIRTYNRNESGVNTDPLRSDQIYTAIEWDLKNTNGIRISSGVYIIHIDAEGIGERVVKWFGSIRRFDSLGL